MDKKEKLLRESYLTGHETSQYEYLQGTWDSDKYYYVELFHLVEEEFEKFFKKLKSNTELKDEVAELKKYLLSQFALTIYKRVQKERIYLVYLRKEYGEFDEIKIITFTGLIKEELLLANVILASLTSNSKALTKLRNHPLLIGKKIAPETEKFYAEIRDEQKKLICEGKTGHSASLRQATRNVYLKKKIPRTEKQIKNTAEYVSRNLRNKK